MDNDELLLVMSAVVTIANIMRTEMEFILQSHGGVGDVAAISALHERFIT